MWDPDPVNLVSVPVWRAPVYGYNVISAVGVITTFPAQQTHLSSEHLNMPVLFFFTWGGGGEQGQQRVSIWGGGEV